MMRRVLRWFLYALGLLLILLICTIGILQTGPAKRLLANNLSAMLSTPTAGFRIAEIRGSIPLQMTLGTIELADRQGVWMKAGGITFDWSPSALLSGRIHIDEIGAERVEIIRPPIGGEQKAEPTSDAPFRLPELPKSLPAVTVDRLVFPDISLGEAMLGEAASFGLEGALRADDAGDRMTATFNLVRTDQPTVVAHFEATADLDPLNLDLAFDASESGGMVAAIAGRPEIGDVTFTLKGSGPLTSWSGKLQAKAEGLASADADLDIALVDQPQFTVDGDVMLKPEVLAGDMAALVGERLSIEVDVVQIKAQALDLRTVSLVTDLASLDAKGSVDFQSGDVALQTTLDVPDLTPFGALSQATLSGSAEAALAVSGALNEPDGQLDLRFDHPVFDGTGAERVATSIRWTNTSPLSSDQPRFAVTIDGGTQGISIPNTVLPDQNVGWSTDLSVPLEGVISIQQFAIETAGVALTASGRIDPQDLEGEIDVALDVPSLARLAEPYGQTLDGEASLRTAIHLAKQASDVAVDLTADLKKLSGLPPGAAELLGSESSLRAKARLDPSRQLHLDTLAIDGAALELRGDGSLHLENKQLAGRVTLALSDLSVLETLMPKGAAGAIELEANLDGILDVPSADIALTSQNLVLAGEPIERLSIDVAGADLVAAPQGNVEMDAIIRKTPLRFGLAYRLVDDVLGLEDILLSAPETNFGGALDVMLDATLIDGVLQGRIGDVAALEPLIGQTIAGHAELMASLTPEGERQNARVTLKTRGVGGDFGSVDALDLNASITNMLAEPGIDMKATITGFRNGATTGDAITLATKGNQHGLDFRLDTIGNVIETLDIKADGNLVLVEGLTFHLESLNGAFAGEPLRIAKPLSFRQQGDQIQLTDFDLRLGDARLSGDIDIGVEAANGVIELRSLPLTWSNVLGGPILTGEVNGNVDLSGGVDSPKVVATLNVDSLVADDVPFNISLNALVGQGQLAAELEGKGLTDVPITATANIPAKLKLNPFTFEVPEDGELEGLIKAELLLERLTKHLALEEQRARGRLNVDLTLGGTLTEPEITGPVTLDDAEFENDATATHIQDVSMEVAAFTERIELKSFAGRTGDTGRIEADGWMELNGDADFPLELTLRLEKADLVERDDVEGRISGVISMAGNLVDATVEGDVTVERAEISIPDGGGPTLPELEVTEVGGDIVNPKDEDEAESKQALDPALDIRIRLPNQIYVRGRGLESEWEGDLDITGYASEPVIVGSIGIKKGYFDFLDKRFELALGEITFSGDTPPNPTIALEARAEDDDFAAIIKLSGPADDPQLLLSSEPILPEDEILARLLFNRDISEIGAVEAGKLALAVNRLRGGGGFDAFSEIRGILNIDTLDVVSDEAGETAVKAGKYLNDDVYVEVEKGSGEESGRARVEIELLPNIALEAESSENADSGVGLKWKFDY